MAGGVVALLTIVSFAYSAYTQWLKHIAGMQTRPCCGKGVHLVRADAETIRAAGQAGSDITDSAIKVSMMHRPGGKGHVQGRFSGAKDAKEFSAGLERAIRAVGDEPKFTPPNVGSGLTHLLARRKEPPPDGPEQDER